MESSHQSILAIQQCGDEVNVTNDGASTHVPEPFAHGLATYLELRLVQPVSITLGLDKMVTVERVV